MYKLKGGYFNIDEWKLKYGTINAKTYDTWRLEEPILSIYLDDIIKNPPSNLPLLVSPTSKRGQDIIEFFKYFESIFNETHDIRSVHWFCTNPNDEYDIQLTTFQCMIFVNAKEDENTHLNIGLGNLDPYNISEPTIIPEQNKLLSQYPYEKAMCPYNYNCKYIDEDSFSGKFKQPYLYLLHNKTKRLVDNSIL